MFVQLKMWRFLGKEEMSSRGGDDNIIPVFEIINPNGTRDFLDQSVLPAGLLPLFQSLYRTSATIDSFLG